MATISAWRLVREKYAAEAFSGEGARLFGGRWNSKGRAVVYAADTPALCQLEVLANVGSYRQLENRLLFSAKIRQDMIEKLAADVLPADWDARPPTQATKQIGDHWIEQKESLALKVPSVLDPYGANILINPHHPDFEAIDIAEGVPYPIDKRLSQWER